MRKLEKIKTGAMGSVEANGDIARFREILTDIKNYMEREQRVRAKRDRGEDAF